MDMREISTRQPILGRQLGINYWRCCLSFWKTIALLSKWSLGTLFHTTDNVIDNRTPKLNQKILEKLDILINNIDQYQYIPQTCMKFPSLVNCYVDFSVLQKKLLIVYWIKNRFGDLYYGTPSCQFERYTVSLVISIIYFI